MPSLLKHRCHRFDALHALLTGSTRALPRDVPLPTRRDVGLPDAADTYPPSGADQTPGATWRRD